MGRISRNMRALDEQLTVCQLSECIAEMLTFTLAIGTV